MTDLFDLTGKTAIVTGAGQGIGFAIAETLAQAGADIAVADLNPETGAEAVSHIESLGRTVLFLQTNVANPDAADAMVASAVSHFGQVDILVNNAGIVKNTAALDVPNEEWLKIMDVNVNGVFWCSRAAARHMLDRESGAIVNIASMSGMIVNRPQPQTSYNVSKAAVIMLTKSLAAEWSASGIRVNSVSPGYIGTELVKNVLSQSEEWSRIWHEMTPIGHIGEPVDVANAVLYLASDAAKFATGTNLVVDGGYAVW